MLLHSQSDTGNTPTDKREGKGQEKKTTGKARLLGKESMAGHKIGP